MENLKQMTDDMLVSLYLKGNNTAFDILLNRHQDRLFNYIYFIVRSKEVAEDIFQETFVKAIVTLQQGRYTNDGKFAAWITIALTKVSWKMSSATSLERTIK